MTRIRVHLRTALTAARVIAWFACLASLALGAGWWGFIPLAALTVWPARPPRWWHIAHLTRSVGSYRPLASWGRHGIVLIRLDPPNISQARKAGQWPAERSPSASTPTG